MYIVYWEYVERAAYFVASRGNMIFGEGSETNAVAKNMKKYGMVPYDHFTGMSPGQKFHNHAPMFDEIKAYLASVKEKNAWNKIEVVATVRSILDHYVGPVPTEVTVNGKKMSPQEYLNNVLQINPDDYVDFMSLMDEAYYQKAEYKVPDNGWQIMDYGIEGSILYRLMKEGANHFVSIRENKLEGEIAHFLAGFPVKEFNLKSSTKKVYLYDLNISHIWDDMPEEEKVIFSNARK